MIRAIRLLFPAALSLLAFPGVLAFSADAAGPSQGDAPSYVLRYHFRPGETIRWEVVHRKRVDTTVSGISQTTETFSKSVKVWRVGQLKADGTATFEQSVEDVDMWHKTGESDEVRYNSRTDRQPPVGYENLAESVGVPLSVVTIDARGEIVNREWKQAKAAARSEGEITIPFPEEAVPVGHTWSRPHTVEVQLNTGTVKKVKTRQQFTLESVRTGVAAIAVATQILTPIDDPALQSQLIQCETRGTVKFDIDAGRIIGQQMDLDKQVVGYPNSASSFHYLTRFTEQLLPAEIKTASR
jgi:hypothetical protein